MCRSDALTWPLNSAHRKSWWDIRRSHHLSSAPRRADHRSYLRRVPLSAVSAVSAVSAPSSEPVVPASSVSPQTLIPAPAYHQAQTPLDVEERRGRGPQRSWAASVLILHAILRR